MWLRLWCRLAAAALIGPLARKLPYAAGVALKRKEEKVPLVEFKMGLTPKECRETWGVGYTVCVFFKIH